MPIVVCADCGEERKHHAKGLCKSCYYKQHRKQWYLANKEYSNMRSKQYYETNRERIIESNRMRRRKIREELFGLFGRRCVMCGFDDTRALQIDHLNGGGTREREKKFKGAYAMYLHILEVNGKGYQLLCANCNAIKRWTNKEGIRNVRAD